MKKILLVNTLPENDLSVSNVVQALESEDNKVQVFYAYEKNFRPCVGCNACWLITPGVCSQRDGYDELLKAYLANDAVIFLSGTTLNFLTYLTNIRMEQAKKLLLTTSLSITEISERSGYKDYRVFTKVFKKSEGITPSQYRRDFLQ